MTEEKNKWLTVEDLSKYLNVSKVTIYRWVQIDDTLPKYRVGKLWRFKLHEIDAWVEQQTGNYFQ